MWWQYKIPLGNASTPALFYGSAFDIDNKILVSQWDNCSYGLVTGHRCKSKAIIVPINWSKSNISTSGWFIITIILSLNEEEWVEFCLQKCLKYFLTMDLTWQPNEQCDPFKWLSGHGEEDNRQSHFPLFLFFFFEKVTDVVYIFIFFLYSLLYR